MGVTGEEASLLLVAPFVAAATSVHSSASSCTSWSRTITAAGNMASLFIIRGGKERARLGSCKRACNRTAWPGAAKLAVQTVTPVETPPAIPFEPDSGASCEDGGGPLVEEAPPTRAKSPKLLLRVSMRRWH